MRHQDRVDKKGEKKGKKKCGESKYRNLDDKVKENRVKTKDCVKGRWTKVERGNEMHELDKNIYNTDIIKEMEH